MIRKKKLFSDPNKGDTIESQMLVASDNLCYQELNVRHKNQEWEEWKTGLPWEIKSNKAQMLVDESPSFRRAIVYVYVRPNISRNINASVSCHSQNSCLFQMTIILRATVTSK